ncbi:efflux RND transporter periplasmic adaptor subunit [Lysobacter sp. N42]|uniref:efflux RND transporter periplasmic adaptor subunit n=2 Tax=Gammaproteobacteria TaxID=1236 RepID=UPI001A9DB36C|nr:efflux RND transporter periplasmic adaptor subunit [Lysobacter sp. N42]
MTIMLVLTAVVFGLIFGYKAVGSYFMNDYFDNMPIPTVTTTATEVKEDTWSRTLTAVGTFYPVNGTEVSSQYPGVIESIEFESGVQVEAGQVLFQLDTEIDEAELARLLAAEDIAQRDVRRLQPLVGEGNVSQQEIQRAQSQLQQAQAAVKAQQTLIDRKTIRAPFSGLVGIRRVHLGQFVNAGQSLVYLESFNPIYLNFTLSERFLGTVNEGDSVSIVADAYNDQTFVGTISALEPRVNSATRTFEVQATVDNPENKLRSGLFGRVELTQGEPRSVKMIPRTAIQFNPYGNVVYVISESEESSSGLSVQQRLIRTGQERGDMVEVIEGLELGERVATSGLLKLRNGVPVQINDNPAYQPPEETAPTPDNE